MGDKYSSPQLVKGMERIFGKETKTIIVKMKNEDEIKKYLQVTEEAHQRATKSTLHFD